MVADAQRLEMLQRAENIVLVGAGLADRAAHHGRRIHRVKRAGILLMLAVDDVGHRLDRAAAVEANLERALEIDVGDQFALAQIGDDLVAQVARHAECQPDAGAATVEAEHQAGPFRVPRCTKEQTQSERRYPCRRARWVSTCAKPGRQISEP